MQYNFANRFLPLILFCLRVSSIRFSGYGIYLIWRPGFGIFKALWGRDSGFWSNMEAGLGILRQYRGGIRDFSSNMGAGFGIESLHGMWDGENNPRDWGLRENWGRDDGIVLLSYLWTDYMRPLLPRVSLTKWTKANEKGRHSYQLDQGMDLLERGLCESHTKVPYESMIEPEESKADTMTHYHHHHYHRQHHHHNHFYRACSLTWPASMVIFANKRKFLHKKRVQFPQGCLATPTWPPFHCFGTPIWPPWRHANTLYSLQISLYIKRFYVYAKFWR